VHRLVEHHRKSGVVDKVPRRPGHEPPLDDYGGTQYPPIWAASDRVLLRPDESFYAVEWSQVQDGVGVWLSTADQRLVASGGLEWIR
jgi:hypothetical protein